MGGCHSWRVPEVSAEYTFAHGSAEAQKYILGKQQKLGTKFRIGKM
jgi:hypothetical protein